MVGYDGYGSLNSAVDYNANFKRLTANQEVDILVLPKKKPTGRHKEKMTLNLRGFKNRLKIIAKKEGRHYHTMATDILVAEVLRIERRYKKEKN